MRQIYIFGIILLIFGAFSTAAYAAHENCVDCHRSAAPMDGNSGLITPLPDLCIDCHPDRVGNNEHAIDIVVKPGMTQVLPLINGKMSCSTCHDVHSQLLSNLRMPTPQLCQNCHHK